MKSRRLLAIILSIISGLSLFSGCENGCGIGWRLYESEYYIYTVGYDSGNVLIFGLTDKGREQEYLVIPETIEGRKVVELRHTDYETKQIIKKYGDAKYSGIQSDKLKKVFIIPQIKIWNMDFFQGAKNLYGVFYLSNNASEYNGVNHYNYYYTKDNEVPKFAWDGCVANVTYYYNYENAPNDGYYWIDDYNYGEMIEYIPENPTRESYQFAGWYKEPECINEWDFETDKTPELQYDENEELIFVETKLYAKWL